jgi:hypothetical protein
VAETLTAQKENWLWRSAGSPLRSTGIFGGPHYLHGHLKILSPEKFSR